MVHRRALVTGATGFIGQSLVGALLDQGWLVKATGRRTHFAGLPAGADYVSADLALDHLGSLADGVEVVFHLAGASSSLSSTEEMFRVNVEGTARLLAAVPPGLKCFVHMSSTSVYGEETPLPSPVAESAAGGPSRTYGQAKWGAEEAVWARAAEGLPVVVLRPVTVFGPGAVKLMASAALDVAIEDHLGLDAVVVPTAIIEQRLVHIDDVISASLHLGESPDAVGRAFNVASLYPSSAEVAGVLADALAMDSRALAIDETEPESGARRQAYGEMVNAGMLPRILFTPERFRFLRKANLNNRLDSTALASIGFSFAHTDLASSVGSTIDWYRQHRWL